MQLFHRKSGSGPPLIILHGLFGSGRNWSGVAKQLSASHEVFLVDQRNHGRSPHNGVLNYEALADDLREFMERQRLSKATIMGHSMGAKAAMAFTQRHPSMVDQLISVDMGIVEYPIQHEALLEGLSAFNPDEIHSRTAADHFLQEYIPDWRTRQFIMQNLYRGSDNKMKWRMNVPAILANAGELGKALVITKPFEGETLFIKGEESDYIRDEDHDAILRVFPNAAFAEVEKAGHWVHADNPKKFMEIVSGFLEKFAPEENRFQ